MQRSSDQIEATPLRFSVIIPTYQRRDVVLASVRSLAQQEFDGRFEVIVVVDGSKDGTADALRDIDVPFPLIIVEQPNRGAASARNRGAAAARGEILLFLDDDMEAHPRLLVEHDRSHCEGANVVLGHIPLHPDSPCNLLSVGVKAWADARARRLSSPEATLTLHDLLTGQISLARTTFQNIGGFDTNFTIGGSFGNEDVDFGYRVLLAGYRVVFNPDAISWQRYVVQPAQYLLQWHQAGYADVAFARKHPEQATKLFELNGAEEWRKRRVWRLVLAVPGLARLLIWILRKLIVPRVARGAQDTITHKLFREVQVLEYWRGVKEAGGIPQPWPLRVLAYHMVKNLVGAPVLEPYGVPPAAFSRQLDILQRAGYHFIDGDEFLRFVNGKGGLPRRPILLTFDDCYQDLLDVALPILRERSIPAVAFAVSGCLGGSNDWDKAIGAPQLQLLDADGLRQLVEQGIEIGAHSRSHRLLTHLSPEDLLHEVIGSVEDIEGLGLPRPRFFSYPHGEYDWKVQQEVKNAGLEAAFTVAPGLVRYGQNVYELPRTEILRSHVGWRLQWTVADAGRLETVYKSIGSLFSRRLQRLSIKIRKGRRASF